MHYYYSTLYWRENWGTETLIYLTRDFPGGPVVKNWSGNAGEAGSIPGWGIKIPHATEQLSPHAATTEPMCHN